MQLHYFGLRWVVKRGGSYQATIHPSVVQHWGRKDVDSFAVCFLESDGKVLIEDFERLLTGALDYPDDVKREALKDYPILRLKKFNEVYKKLTRQLAKGEIEGLNYEKRINELLNQFKGNSLKVGHEMGRRVMKLVDSGDVAGILSLIRSLERTERAQRLEALLEEVRAIKEDEKDVAELLSIIEGGRESGRISGEEYRMIREVYDEELNEGRMALSRLRSCLES
jgi:polyhydroxyalkanoate synthesis regulator phasin